jgi:hypothetical protein
MVKTPNMQKPVEMEPEKSIAVKVDIKKAPDLGAFLMQYHLTEL